MDKSRSFELFQKARNFIPGGVNSPVRAFGSVGGNPLFFQKANGSRIWDIDGNEYIDYVCSCGPHLFWHNPEFVINAIKEELMQALSFGAPCENEIKLAELICELMPSIELVRMTNSGTEATMSAIRLARGFTGKDKIIKFEGCYHGHCDSFLIKAGSGALTFGVPTSPGVTSATASDTLIADFNNIESVKKLISSNKGEIAAIIIEPVAGNMGVIPSDSQFLYNLRNLCSDEKILLIFDEVMTGFRVASGGAQQLYGIIPDLTTLGKIIGGGLPVGAFGGIRNIMERISPSGPIYQAGTLSGNPIAMAAGIAMLSYIKEHPDIYYELEKKAQFLSNAINDILLQNNLNYSLNRCASMLTLFFTSNEAQSQQSQIIRDTPFQYVNEVNNYKAAVSSDTNKFAQFFHKMLEQGIYLPPSQFEAWFISTAHSDEDLKKTVDAILKAIA